VCIYLLNIGVKDGLRLRGSADSCDGSHRVMSWILFACTGEEDVETLATALKKGPVFIIEGKSRAGRASTKRLAAEGPEQDGIQPNGEVKEAKRRGPLKRPKKAVGSDSVQGKAATKPKEAAELLAVHEQKTKHKRKQTEGSVQPIKRTESNAAAASEVVVPLRKGKKAATGALAPVATPQPPQADPPATEAEVAVEGGKKQSKHGAPGANVGELLEGTPAVGLAASKGALPIKTTGGKKKPRGKQDSHEGKQGVPAQEKAGDAVAVDRTDEGSPPTGKARRRQKQKGTVEGMVTTEAGGVTTGTTMGTSAGEAPSIVAEGSQAPTKATSKAKGKVQSKQNAACEVNAEKLPDVNGKGVSAGNVAEGPSAPAKPAVSKARARANQKKKEAIEAQVEEKVEADSGDAMAGIVGSPSAPAKPAGNKRKGTGKQQVKSDAAAAKPSDNLDAGAGDGAAAIEGRLPAAKRGAGKAKGRVKRKEQDVVDAEPPEKPETDAGDGAAAAQGIPTSGKTTVSKAKRVAKKSKKDAVEAEPEEIHDVSPGDVAAAADGPLEPPKAGATKAKGTYKRRKK
jgi:hypothetical protein